MSTQQLVLMPARGICKTAAHKVHAVRTDGTPLCGGGHLAKSAPAWQADIGPVNCAACLKIKETQARGGDKMIFTSSILEAREQLAPTKLFCIGYAWQDKTFGELEGSTVVDSIDAQVAVRSFKSKRPDLTRAWLIHGGEQ